MQINIITEKQVRMIVKKEIGKNEEQLWKQMDRLRKRIVELEMKDMDINKLKMHNENRK